MIKHESAYLRWIQQQGVGKNDRVASSPRSYISYLNAVSELLGRDISPEILSSEQDVLAIARTLKGARADATLRNYQSAMRQYVSMVQTGVLSR